MHIGNIQLILMILKTDEHLVLCQSYFEEVKHEDCDDDRAETGEKAEQVEPGHAAELSVQDAGRDHHENGEEDIVDRTHLVWK